MEEFKYVSFTGEDIIEALEDLYYKRTNEKIDIRFDEDNSAIKQIRRINIKKSLSLNECTVEKSVQPKTVEYSYDEGENVAEMAEMPKMVQKYPHILGSKQSTR